MDAGKLNIEITAGNMFGTTLRIEDIDLTAATLKMQMRDVVTNQAFDFTISDVEARTSSLTHIYIFMSHTVTNTLTPGRQYSYDLQFTVGGEPDNLIEGSVTVKRGTTV